MGRPFGEQVVGVTPPETGLVVIPTVMPSHAEGLSALRRSILLHVADQIRLTFVVVCNSRSTASLSYPEFVVLRPRENLGFGGAANLAWRAMGRRDWLFLVNDDLAFDPMKVDGRMLGDILSDRLVLHSIGPVNQRTAIRLWSPTVHVFRSLSLLQAVATALVCKPGVQVHGESMPRGYVTGLPWLVVSGEVFERLDGFDPGINLYFEDTDFVLRAQKAGLSVRCWRSEAVTHLKSSSRTSRRYEIMYAEAVNAVRFVEKHGSSLVVARAALAMAALIRTVLRLPSDPWAGVLEGGAMLRAALGRPEGSLPYDGWCTEEPQN